MTFGEGALFKILVTKLRFGSLSGFDHPVRVRKLYECLRRVRPLYHQVVQNDQFISCFHSYPFRSLKRPIFRKGCPPNDARNQ